jgi:tetratricopeptide (TPR) repeat protein
VTCPTCQTVNPAAAIRCVECSSLIIGGDATIVMSDAEVASVQEQSRSVTSATGAGPETLAPGELLGTRYEILSVLGQGGMGAVYKALDRELGRTVALKMIRADMVADSQILERFKQEVVLASQVTHPNVVRIYDLGSEGKQRFLTMEYVEGQDLRTLSKEKNLSFGEIESIFRQVCLGLDAAHKVKVVHRDLKPQNIMVEPGGRVAVMDFGLAHSSENTWLTKPGMILGTPDYMSPEQAMGKALDQRTDIYSLGIILYELLTGRVPFQSETVIGTLVARTREMAAPATELNPAIPERLNRIVMKCLATDRDHRYTSIFELLAELEGSTAPPEPAVPLASPFSRRRMLYVAGGGAAAAAAGAIYYFTKDSSLPLRMPGTVKPVSVLVADFKNETGDAVFDGALEPAFSLALEEAGFVSTYNRTSARRVASQLMKDANRMDETLARLVAVREGVNVVISGTVKKSGSDFEVNARVVDASKGTVIAQSKTTAGSRDKVLGTMAKLASPIRTALGDSTPESVQISAAETYTTSSLEAAQAYATAQELRFSGKAEQAIQKYKDAIWMDPNFGSAYYSLAATFANLGQRKEAEKYYQMAMARIDRLTERERHRMRGGYYLVMLNHEKAIDEFSQLVKQYPADTGGMSNLAYVYFLRRDIPNALEQSKKALAIYPKVPLYRNNLAMYLMYNGEFEEAAKEAAGVIQASPTYLKAQNTLALSQLGAEQTTESAAGYSKLATMGARGASYASMGLADLALYEGRLADAREWLTKGIAQDTADNNDAAVAKKQAVLASALLKAGKKAEALAMAGKAIANREVLALYEAAMVYIECGMDAKAKAIVSELSQRLELDPQMYAKLIEGEIELAHGRGREALRLFQDARKLTDSWLSRLSAARAYLQAGNFAEANSELEVCRKRRGEATELFLDESQTYRYVPLVTFYEAKTQEGLGSPGAKETYQRFLKMKAADSQEPLVVAARKLAGM